MPSGELPRVPFGTRNKQQKGVASWPWFPDPMPIQPATFSELSADLQYEAPAPDVVLPPVQRIAYGVRESATAETSGSSRHRLPLAARLQ